MNKTLDKGQYDTEYKKTNCFWGTKPGKFVKNINKYITDGNNKTVLDIGAGEGKNSIYLESLGYKVDALEVSLYAVKNFIDQIIKNETDLNKKLNINLICADALNYQFANNYDLVVAYGLLHCLPSVEAVEKLVLRMQELTKKDGYNIITTFTNNLPVPDLQDYLDLTLISEDKLAELYKDWEILEYENEVLEHTHSTHDKPHKHSICRIIARKK